MLGNNREIFFPKLKEEQMTSFDKIAEDLLKTLVFSIDYCDSDKEAIERASCWSDKEGYPVHFSKSDTDGEKEYEEFYVEGEKVDFDSFRSLGVIKEKDIPSREKVSGLIDDLNSYFDNDDVKKIDVVRIIKDYLPNFEHIETGKSLDGKM